MFSENMSRSKNLRLSRDSHSLQAFSLFKTLWKGYNLFKEVPIINIYGWGTKYNSAYKFLIFNFYTGKRINKQWARTLRNGAKSKITQWSNVLEAVFFQGISSKYFQKPARPCLPAYSLPPNIIIIFFFFISRFPRTSSFSSSQ